ncbi:M23 family metallopeptidase [Brevundimonas sp.]|jgi:septal ring factor EnvC (AmiA/AmiB activator)|uniref:murein hydrolase activator EnvC family protein n=1 Tax=Brevundimonas sp. TaxID=1871086 RepID=UPI002E0E458D|nr:M23 family metallopeptidase [Brevundimonas sp.]
MRRFLIPALCLTLAAVPAAGQPAPPEREAARLQAQYRDAVVRLRRLEVEARAAERAAASTPLIDATPSADRARLDAVAAREAPVLSALAGLRARQGRLLAALQRLMRRPPPPLIVPAARAVDARRAALLMREAAVAIEDQARPLQARRTALARERRTVLLSQAGALAADSAAGERAALASDRRGDRRARAVVLAAEARAARQEVAALEARLRRLGAAVPVVPPDAAARVSALPGGRSRLTPPTSGPPAARFGRDVPGWRWVGTGGPAVAPALARVAWAGPHEAWGRLVILDLGDGWQAVILGLADLSVSTGDRVEAGQALGATRAGEPLQFELRRQEAPVDPGRFLDGG